MRLKPHSGKHEGLVLPLVLPAEEMEAQGWVMYMIYSPGRVG